MVKHAAMVEHIAQWLDILSSSKIDKKCKYYKLKKIGKCSVLFLP